MPFSSKQIALCWWKEVELTCHVLTGFFFYFQEKLVILLEVLYLKAVIYPYMERETGDLKLKS